MTKLEQLNAEFMMSSKEVERIKEVYLAKKRELVEVETLLVEAREKERQNREQFEVYRDTYTIESSLDDWNRKLIAEFTQRMPAVMALIEHEKPLLPVSVGTLDKSKSRR